MTLSPKGNQPKHYDGDYFLKVDSFGGEVDTLIYLESKGL